MARNQCRAGRPAPRPARLGVGRGGTSWLCQQRNSRDKPWPLAYRGAMATVDITGEQFASTVEDNDIVLVDFWAEWCGPCKQFGPTYAAVSEKHQDVVFSKVDTEAEQQLAAEAGITSIPTLMAFREKVLVWHPVGAGRADRHGSGCSRCPELLCPHERHF